MNGIISPIERKQWFIDRIGKRVYRDNSLFINLNPEERYKEIVIGDLQHACYLYDVECECNCEGIPLRYFDTKEEVEQFKSE